MDPHWNASERCRMRRRTPAARRRWPRCLGDAGRRAIAPETIRDLAFGESDARGKAIAAIVASGDPQALPLLQAVLDGDVKTAGEDRVLQVKGDAATDLLTGKTVTPAAREPRRPRRQQPHAPRARHGDRRAEARRHPTARRASPRQRSCRAPPTKTRCRRSRPRSPRKPIPEIKGLLVLTQASIQLASSDQGDATCRGTRARRSRQRKHQDAAPRRARARRAASSSSPTRRACAPKPSASLSRRRISASPTGEMIGRDLQRHLARHDPAAGGAGPRDHLRPDGRASTWRTAS